MIAELSIWPIGEGAHLTHAVAKAIQTIKDSGLEYRVTAMGTIVEGDPDVVWAVLRKCHDDIFATSMRVLTQIRIDKFDSEHSQLDRATKRVEATLDNAPGEQAA